MAPAPPLPVTEDTPPDMLAGSMDLRVVLPNGSTVKMSVERSTPMMDLLVQVTTLNKLSTGGHVLQAIGEMGILPYKPSTPIGALDAWTIQVVPKLKGQMNTGQKKTPLKPLNRQQPFEQTFRLQVHLPRNQLFVMRVSPRTLLSDILQLTCTEKNLDPNKYELRHPANLSQLLSPSCTLADYGLHEVTVVVKSRAPGMGSALSSSDIMALQREEDKRRQQARQQHGAGTGLGLVCNKRNRSSYCDGSISSDSLGGRSISPARSDESASRSASPQAPNLPPMMAPVPPARPARKRRPAPKPPCPNSGPISSEQQMESNVQAESSSGTVVNGHSGSNNSNATHVPVSHSRNSSDSSGYHEASVLSESPAEGSRMSENCTVDTLPRQGKLTSGHQTQMKARGASHGLSRSMSSLSGVDNMAGCQHSTSNSSLASSTGQGQKKKRAPPPPPGVGVTKDDQQQRHSSSLSLSSTDQNTTESFNKTTSLERHMSGKNSAVASDQSPDKSSTLPGKMKMSHNYRPVETTVQTSADTLEIEKQSPEEMCLDEDEKISEVEHASVPNVPKETSPIHSETHEDELINATKNQSSDRDTSKTQDECFQQSPVPPVETAPVPPVELASRSKCPQTVDTRTPQAPAALEQEPTLHIPVPKPRIRSKPTALDDTVPLARRMPLPPPRLMSNSSSSSVLQSTNMNSSNVQEERCIQSVNAEGGSDGRSTKKKQQGKNGSAGQTFGVGTTVLTLSQFGTDSISSGSWEYHSIRSQGSADVYQDSDDDLNFTEKEMDMFHVMKETSEVSGTVQGGNENQNNTAAAANRVVDSYDDCESVSLVSSVFDYDSEHESSDTSSTFKYPPLHTQKRTKVENVYGASNVGSPHVTGRKGLQKKVVPGVGEGSSTSLQSTDRAPAFMENSNNSMVASASKQSRLLGYDSEASTLVNSGVAVVDQVEEAFKSVIVELEDTIRQDEDLNTLPPPPTSASSVDDLAVDWQYQLPAPSAFRDSDSPTLTEGGTIMLADSQVFREPSLSAEPQPNICKTVSPTMGLQESLNLSLSNQIHRNNVTHINPLFDPHHFEDKRKPSALSDDGMETFNSNTKQVCHQERQSQKQNIKQQELLNSDFWKDQRKEMSTRTGVPGNHEPINFTITTYQRPQDTDKLFNKDGEKDRPHFVQHSSPGSSKITRGVLQHRYSSTSSLNSSTAGLSRTNSFSNSAITSKPHGPVSTTSVKRSTSYVSLLTNPLSQHRNDFQSGHANILYTSRTTSVGNLTAEAQLDTGNKRTYETWGLRKTTSEDNVTQDMQECLQDGTTSQSRVEEQKNTHVGQEEWRSSQQQTVVTEEEQEQLLAQQEQFLQQLSQPQTSNTDAPLQSLQVLRSILPQLNQSNVLRDNQAVIQQQKSDSMAFLRSKTSPTKLTSKNAEELSNHNSVKDATSTTSEKHNTNEKTPNDKNTSEGKRYTYQGPPAINFATWSERPKSQVTIKMDRDYRTGIGQAGRMDECNETPAQTGNSESKGKTSVVERNGDIETLQQSRSDEGNAQNKVNNKVSSSQQVTKIEPASLTMRLISHTTATGFRKPVAAASQKFGSSSYTAEEAQKVSTSEAKEATGSSTASLQVGSTFQQSDPSRVPIVRAVELKKSFIQQQNMHSNSHALHRSSTKLNGEEDGGHRGANMVDQRKSTSHHNGGSDEDLAVQTFAGVNILAKRFSSVVSSANGPPGFSTSQPLSFCGEVNPVDTKGNDSTTSLPYNSTLSYKSVSSTNLNASNVNKYQDTQLKNGDGRGPQRYTSVVGINSDSDHSLLSSFHEPASESNRVLSRVPGPSVVRVNGFTAPKQLMPVVKGFQFSSAAANTDTSPPSPTKISNTSAHGPRFKRSESTSAIRSWRTVDTTDPPSSTGFGNINTYVQKNSNESRPANVIMNVTTNVESKPPPPPPQAVFLRKSTTQSRPKSLPAPQLNPRDQLMDAIRNFGGREKLKNIHDNRDSSLNTVLIQ